MQPYLEFKPNHPAENMNIFIQKIKYFFVYSSNAYNTFTWTGTALIKVNQKGVNLYSK